MSPRLRRQVLAGVTLDDGPITVDGFKIVSTHGGESMVEVVLHEGRNRIVRRLFDRLGHPVLRLSRTAIGPIRLGTLGSGQARELTQDELGTLLDAVAM